MFTKFLAVAVISLGATLGQATAAEYYCKIQKRAAAGMLAACRRTFMFGMMKRPVRSKYWMV